VNPGEHRRMFAVEDRHWWYVGLHELVLAVVQRVAAAAPGPLQILDAGCGTGRLMQLLQRAGAVEGCDIAPEAAACCRERGLSGVAVADLNDVRLPAGHFDVITAIDVLYHRGIRDEIAVLGALAGALKPGGVLIRNDPACEGLRSTHDAAVHTRERYTAREVARRLAAAGLAPQLVTYRLAALAPLIALHRLARRRHFRGGPGAAISDVRLPHPLVNRALLATVRLENRRLLRRPLPVGTSVFAVASRPVR
jgi:SAM-dependent methyltransferase